ncbi:hypothetical protein [Marinoscillum luteum]|uniref:DUF4136 domain-containing protein n=1 Tax=Marinoscillum luteum TaxID=861051 RepID=A0ABW7N410_9BACT
MKRLFLFFCLFPVLCYSQNKKEFTLYLSVSADDIIEAQAKSNISRLLREFSDVTITDSYDCNYELRIIILENHNKSGYQTGYTASINILKPLTPTDFTFPIAQRYTEENRKDEDDFLELFNNKMKIDTSYIFYGIADKIYEKGVYQTVNSFLFVDNELRSICERIVAEIDTEILEPDRIAYDKIWKN